MNDRQRLRPGTIRTGQGIDVDELPSDGDDVILTVAQYPIVIERGHLRGILSVPDRVRVHLQPIPATTHRSTRRDGLRPRHISG